MKRIKRFIHVKSEFKVMEIERDGIVLLGNILCNYKCDLHISHYDNRSL